MGAPDIKSVIGVDPGLISAGAACLDPDTGKITKYLVSSGNPKGKGIKIPTSPRVFEIYHKMFKALDVGPGLHLLCCEGPAFMKGSSSLEQMARCRQAVYDMGAFFLEDFIWMEVSPTMVKRRVTGKGTASKDEVALAMSNLGGKDLSILTKNTHAIGDASAVAYTGLLKYRELVEKEDKIRERRRRLPRKGG